jgi:hypothetical protein
MARTCTNTLRLDQGTIVTSLRRTLTLNNYYATQLSIMIQAALNMHVFEQSKRYNNNDRRIHIKREDVVRRNIRYILPTFPAFETRCR